MAARLTVARRDGGAKRGKIGVGPLLQKLQIFAQVLFFK